MKKCCKIFNLPWFLIAVGWRSRGKFTFNCNQQQRSRCWHWNVYEWPLTFYSIVMCLLQCMRQRNEPLKCATDIVKTLLAFDILLRKFPLFKICKITKITHWIVEQNEMLYYGYDLISWGAEALHVVSYQNESFSSKQELPCLPPSSLDLWRRKRASRQLSFWWKTLILIGHYGIPFPSSG